MPLAFDPDCSHDAPPLRLAWPVLVREPMRRLLAPTLLFALVAQSWTGCSCSVDGDFAADPMFVTDCTDQVLDRYLAQREEEADGGFADGGHMVLDCKPVHYQLKADLADPDLKCLRDTVGPGEQPCLPNPDACLVVEVVQEGFNITHRCTLANQTVVTRTGTLDLARCVDYLSEQGTPCRVCSTPKGELVRDSCHLRPDESQLRCESLVAMDGAACTVCTAVKGGEVVLRECKPSGTTQSNPEDDPALGQCQVHRNAAGDRVGKDCQVDQLERAAQRCRLIRLEPAEVVGAPQVCRMCMDEDDHVTTLYCAEERPSSCKSFMAAGGSFCTVCQDAATGVEVSRTCSPQPEPGLVCATLADFVGGPRCEVCQDSQGRLVSRRCAVAGCVPGSRQPECQGPVPTCQVIEHPQRGVCDLCGDVNGDGQLTEDDWRCTRFRPQPTGFKCDLEDDVRHGQPGSCKVCRKLISGAQWQEVSRSCAEGGAVPGAMCGTMSLPHNNTCMVCTDAHGLIIEDDCNGDLTCNQTELNRTDGTMATCERCVEARFTCTTDTDCGKGQACGMNGCYYPTELQNLAHIRQQTCVDQLPSGQYPTVCSLGSNGVYACPRDSGQWMVILPGNCQVPWEEWWEMQDPDVTNLPVDANDQGEVARTWLKQVHGIEVLGHRLEMGVAPEPSPDCTGCGCPRGEGLFVLARAEQMVKLMRIGFVLAP